LGDPSLRTAGFVGFQMCCAAIAVTLTFGFIEGATFGFFAVPAGMLATATIFGRLRRPAPATASSASPQTVAAPTARPHARPLLRVVSGQSRAHSA
jgi:hypothetical protein